MPIFEYCCRSCDHRFETIVLSQQETISCPKCKSSTLEKQLSVFAAPGSSNQDGDAAGGCACTPTTCGCH